jgi:cysteine desulfurase
MGFLYHRKGVGFTPLIHGGGQERGRRAGTENLLAISVFEKQIDQLHKLIEVTSRITELRDHMEKRVLDEISGVQFLAKDRLRLPNTSLMLIEGVHGETMLINSDIAGYEVSTGAACSSGNPEPSPVLIAMGLSPQEASKSLRVSLGWQTTQDEIDRFVDALIKVVAKLRGL